MTETAMDLRNFIQARQTLQPSPISEDTDSIASQTPSCNPPEPMDISDENTKVQSEGEISNSPSPPPCIISAPKIILHPNPRTNLSRRESVNYFENTKNFFSWNKNEPIEFGGAWNTLSSRRKRVTGNFTGSQITWDGIQQRKDRMMNTSGGQKSPPSTPKPNIYKVHGKSMDDFIPGYKEGDIKPNPDIISINLCRNRALNSNGCRREPISFPQDDSEIFYSDDEDMEDNTCRTCFQSSINISNKEHQSLGPFAISHVLGPIAQNMKAAIAIIALTEIKDYKLICKHCDQFKTDLHQTSTIKDIDHLFRHGNKLGENSDVKTILGTVKNENLHLCVQCTQVYPSHVALLLHATVSTNHNSLQTIYCGRCQEFIENTTQISHAQRFHNLEINCPQCPLTQSDILDTLFHFTNKSVHPKTSDSMRQLLNVEQIWDVDMQRSSTCLTLTPAKEFFIKIMESNNYHNHIEYATQPDLCRNHSSELNQDGVGFPADTMDLISKFINYEDSVKLSLLMSNIRFGNPLHDHRKVTRSLYYEVISLLVHSSFKDIYALATITPNDVELYLYGPEQERSTHLLGPSILTKSPNLFSLRDLENFDAITFGQTGLQQSGTTFYSTLRILNLSPSAENDLWWPTTFLNDRNPTSLQGSLNIKNMYTECVPSDRNFIQLLRDQCIRIGDCTPIFAELNILPFLRKHHPSYWSKILSINLNNIIMSFFVGICKIRQECDKNISGTPEIVVIGQYPFSGHHQIPAAELLDIWQRINECASLVARFTRVQFIPTSGLIGYGKRFRANDLGNPQPTFNWNGELSEFSKLQGLTLIEIYLRNRSLIKNLLK